MSIIFHPLTDEQQERLRHSALNLFGPKSGVVPKSGLLRFDLRHDLDGVFVLPGSCHSGIVPVQQLLVPLRERHCIPGAERHTPERRWEEKNALGLDHSHFVSLAIATYQSPPH